MQAENILAKHTDLHYVLQPAQSKQTTALADSKAVCADKSIIFGTRGIYDLIGGIIALDYILQQYHYKHRDGMTYQYAYSSTASFYKDCIILRNLRSNWGWQESLPQ